MGRLEPLSVSGSRDSVGTLDAFTVGAAWRPEVRILGIAARRPDKGVEIVRGMPRIMNASLGARCVLWLVQSRVRSSSYSTTTRTRARF
jgi:hypothetical protein